MKRMLVLVLMLIYTNATSGIVMSVHYCMGDIAGVSLGENISHQCSTCGMSGQDCCHDELHVAKLDNGFFEKIDLPTFPNLQASLVEHHPNNASVFFLIDRPIIRKVNTVDTGQSPIYTFICQYRI